MACAGYLVRNNTTIVYAEIVNGLLVCSSVAHHRAQQEAAAVADDASHGLPLLAPKRMERAASLVVAKMKRSGSNNQPQPEDEDVASDALEKPIDEPRILQLSGHVVDVVDCDDEGDYAVVPILPFSFRVQTNKLTIHSDASVTASPVDTLLLAAVDQAAKDEWMQRLTRWSRYGWRETTLLAATDEVSEALELALQRWRDSEATSMVKPTAFAIGCASASSRSSRRRFYRNTGLTASAYAPVDQSTMCDNEWFHKRVVKTHI